MGFHVVKSAVFSDFVQSRLIQFYPKKICDLLDGSLKVALHIVEMDQLDVWQIADSPPGFDIFPKWPKGMTVSFNPIMIILMNGIRWWFDGRPHPSRRIVQCIVPGLIGIGMMVVHAPDCITPIAPDIDVFCFW